MGFWKDISERLGGGSPIAYEDHFVCADCFGDDALKSFIEGEAASKTCSFCGADADEPIAAWFVDVLLYINECLRREYDDAANTLPYESAEGGYQGTFWTTRELLDGEIGLDLPKDEGPLLDALCNGLADQAWSRANPYSLTDAERMSFSWDEFCEVIKHDRRFYFLSTGTKSDELFGPADLLRILGDWCERFELVKALPKGSKIFRARYQNPGQTLRTAKELGPPPHNNAKSSRMSPAGIVMLYVSDDPETSLRETANAPGNFAIGEFETREDCQILDLAEVPDVPSIFETIPETLEYDPRPPTIFLNHFVTDISKPIARDDRVHIDYVPTQVITEYFRTQFFFGNKNIQGIRYPSSRHDGHYSIVLFASQSDIISEGGEDSDMFGQQANPWIALVNRSERDVTTDDVDRWEDQAPPEVEWV